MLHIVVHALSERSPVPDPISHVLRLEWSFVKPSSMHKSDIVRCRSFLPCRSCIASPMHRLRVWKSTARSLVAQKINLSRAHRRSSRVERSKTARATMCGRLRVHVRRAVAITTLRASTRRASQTAFLRPRGFAKRKIAHPCLLFDLLRCNSIPMTRWISRHRCPHLTRWRRPGPHAHASFVSSRRRASLARAR